MAKPQEKFDVCGLTAADDPWPDCKGIMYIAGPMSNLSRTHLLKLEWDTSWIQGWLLRYGWASYNPYSSGHCADNFNISQPYWIRHAFKVLQRCDALLLTPGWEKSDGSNKELGYATLLGKPVYDWTWTVYDDDNHRYDGVMRRWETLKEQKEKK